MVIYEPCRYHGRRLDGASDRGRVDLVLFMIFVGIAAILAGLVYWSAKSVSEHEAYAIVRGQEVVESGSGPTVLFSVPFGDEIVTYPSGEIETTFSAGHYLTNTKVTVLLKISARWKVDDAARFHHAVYFDFDRAKSRLSAYSQKSLKDVVGRINSVDESSLETIARAVRDQVRPKAADIGIELIDIAVEQANATPEG